MADSIRVQDFAAAPVTGRSAPRHSATVRITHWITTLCFFALLVSGIELVISHPRFYWGEEGNVMTPALFQLPIPASRGAVKTGYGFVLPDQNGWSRALHFEAAWLVVFTGIFYVAFGSWRRGLLPAKGSLTGHGLIAEVRKHMRFQPPEAAEAWSYNVLQRLAYLAVIFGLFPLMIWTGLAMSPAFTSAVPASVNLLGGHQSARTIHFFACLALVLFLIVHIGMICLAGFNNRVRAMLTGRVPGTEEKP
jgi:thiosulfate reductase cytochrome b subunit